jgi:general secretion pathway protein C
MTGLGRSFSPQLAYRALEVMLLILVAVQLARLVWAVVTPAGPLGDVRAAPVTAKPSADFDPFFRLSSQPGSAVVTSLALKLFGVRVDEAIGGGSAIIATPDGVQSSFGVGDEILPGVKLKQVAFDSVTIERNGISEQLFLDQSVAAPLAAPKAAATSALPTTLQNEIGYAPRLTMDKVTGITVNPRGNGDLFREMGLQPGDVVTAINGQPVASADAVAGQLSAGGSISLQIERAGRTINVTSGAPKQ